MSAEAERNRWIGRDVVFALSQGEDELRGLVDDWNATGLTVVHHLYEEKHRVSFYPWRSIGAVYFDTE